jgi:hypothetical protein
MRAFLATVVILLIAAAPAGAAVRLTTPTASGGEPCNPTPCPITTAIQSAHAGDEVIVGTGTYALGNTVLGTGSTANLNIHGQAGAPRPILTTTTGGSVLIVGGANITVSDLDLREGIGTGSNTVALQLGGGATVDDVAVSDAGAPGQSGSFSYGINLDGTATIRDSTVLVRGNSAVGIGGVATGVGMSFSSSLVHDTVFAPGFGSVGIRADAIDISGCAICSSSALALRDVLVRGGAGLNSADLQSVVAGSQAGTIDAQYSDYVTTIDPSSKIVATNDIASAPLLADPTNGDFHELPGSPTIDAGQTQPLDDLSDPDDRPRVLGAATDIGAFEAPFPVVQTTQVLPTGFTTATVAATIDGYGEPTSVTAQYGATTAYGLTTIPVGVTDGAAHQLLIPLTGLTPGTTYHVRIAASQAFGTATSNDLVVTMPAAVQTVAAVTAFKISPTKFRVAPLGATKAAAKKKTPKTPAGSTFLITANLATTVTIAITHQFHGIRVNGKCVTRSSKHRHGKACSKTIADGTISSPRPQGASKLAFSGRIAGRALKPGHYTATATAGGGTPAGKRTATFTIVSR